MTHFHRTLLIAVLAWTPITPAFAIDGGTAYSVEHVVIETFQIRELVPNATGETMEVPRSSGTLVRADSALHAFLSTQHLPEAVYTFWWHLTHPDGEVSILWGGSQIVANANGNLVLSTTLPEGEDNAPGHIFIGHGLQPGTAAEVDVELWIRSHGPLSDDPETAQEQQTMPFGGCTDVRNPNPRPDDYPCWNPQRAVFSACSTGTVLCLGGERFRAEVEWRDFKGDSGRGQVAEFRTDDSGMFWFFDSGNWELTVKVLDACWLNGHFWVFSAATTNIEYTLRITDTETGDEIEYFNALGNSASAITDTNAFATCR